jgi:hypothetical protein
VCFCLWVGEWVCCFLTVFETSTQTWSHDVGSSELAGNKGRLISHSVPWQCNVGSHTLKAVRAVAQSCYKSLHLLSSQFKLHVQMMWAKTCPLCAGHTVPKKVITHYSYRTDSTPYSNCSVT